MLYIKTGKYMYLIDYNFKSNLLVWSNIKELAISSTDMRYMVCIKKFLKKQHNLDCELVFE